MNNPVSTDFLTVLRCLPGKRASKLYRDALADPEDYDAGWSFDPLVFPIADLASLANILNWLRPQQAFVVRGAVKAGATPGPILRRKHDRNGVSASLEPAAHFWAALDADNTSTPFDPLDPRGSVERWRATLPTGLREAECLVQFTAKQHRSPTVRIRAWFWADRPIDDEEGAEWARSNGFDPATFRTVQPIYTADPLFVGCADPIDRTVCHFPGGLARFELTSEQKAAIEQERVRKNTRVERDPGDHNGLFYELLAERCDILRQVDEGKWIVQCPDEHEHSSSGGTGTVLWAPREGQELGMLHCSHTSAGHDTRTASDWLRRFDATEIETARAKLPTAVSPGFTEAMIATAVQPAALPLATPGVALTPPANVNAPRRSTLTERLSRLQNQGPAHPTGVPPLDRALRGGLREEKVLIAGGAPGAGKTALLRQIGDYLCRTGVAVGWLACDEEPSAIDGRRLQAIGVPRHAAEQPDAATLELAQRDLESLPFEVFDGAEGWTLERVFGEMARLYPTYPRAIIADSLQTVRTERTASIDSERGQVDDVLNTAKALARAPETRAMVAFTSELARGSYRSEASADAISDLAAFKESGGIEYYGHTLLVLRSVKGDGSFVDVSMPKNRLGPKIDFLLKMDSETTNLVETFEDPKTAALETAARAAIPAVTKALEDSGELSGRGVEDLVPCARETTRAALRLMAVEGLVSTRGGARGAVLWRLGRSTYAVGVSVAPPVVMPAPPLDQSLEEMATALGKVSEVGK